MRHVMLFATFPYHVGQEMCLTVPGTQRQSDDHIMFVTGTKTTGG